VISFICSQREINTKKTINGPSVQCNTTSHETIDIGKTKIIVKTKSITYPTSVCPMATQREISIANRWPLYQKKNHTFKKKFKKIQKKLLKMNHLMGAKM
jgi:hypothetical protein